MSVAGAGERECARWTKIYSTAAPASGMTVSLDRDRFVGTMKEQAEIGATDGGGLHRLALSDDDRRARDWVHEQM